LPFAKDPTYASENPKDEIPHVKTAKEPKVGQSENSSSENQAFYALVQTAT
jgi:hypothetical protein